MRGNLTDLIPRPNVRGRVKETRLMKPYERVKSIVLRDEVRVLSILGLIILLMTVSLAGAISGLSLLILAMISMNSMSVISSSLLLSASIAVFLLCYLWLTA